MLFTRKTITQGCRWVRVMIYMYARLTHTVRRQELLIIVVTIMARRCIDLCSVARRRSGSDRNVAVFDVVLYILYPLQHVATSCRLILCFMEYTATVLAHKNIESCVIKCTLIHIQQEHRQVWRGWDVIKCAHANIWIFTAQNTMYRMNLKNRIG